MQQKFNKNVAHPTLCGIRHFSVHSILDMVLETPLQSRDWPSHGLLTESKGMGRVESLKQCSGSPGRETGIFCVYREIIASQGARVRKERGACHVGLKHTLGFVLWR